MARTTLLISPTFMPGVAGSGTLDFTGLGIDIREIYAVTNKSRGDVMIYGAVEGFGATSIAAGPIITLSVDTTGHNGADVLQIIGEEQSVDGSGITQPTGGKGIRGWLSGIYASVSGTLSTNIAKFGNAVVSLGQKAMSASIPVVLPSDQIVSVTDVTPDSTSSTTLTGTGTVGTLSSGAAKINSEGSYTVVIKISSSWTGTISFYQTIDNGASFDLVKGVPNLGGASTSSTTVNGEWIFNCGGFKEIWVVATSVTGTASVVLNSSIAQQEINANVYGAAAEGSVPAAPPVFVGGKDSNGLKRALLTDLNGSLMAGNFAKQLREPFQTYVANGAVWNETKQSGDIIQVDGNSVAASYLVISKDPITANGESKITSVDSFYPPYELIAGLHTSQRTLGQEFSVELVSTETPLSTITDVAISSVSQATTTLTVTTGSPHGLTTGECIGIRDCNDSRINYSALVVASVPSPTQFTATAGPGGNIPSLTIGPFTTGFVYYRSRLGYAPNGVSQIFENVTPTNASYYVRSSSGDALPSGTILGNHSVTIATSVSVQSVVAAYIYSFQPTTEYRLSQFIDNFQWTDIGVDALTASNSRHKRTQVVPDNNIPYRLRIRATNLSGLTRPVAKIVSYSKSGSTTATITTESAHGLTTADLINIYGSSNQTDFPNLTAATAVASIVNSTQFTVLMGASVPTITSFGGGYVSRVNGGITQQGAITMVVTNVVRTSNILTITGSATWSGFSIGDYINLHGVRKTSDGSDLGVDGSYRIRTFATTSLEIEPIGSGPTGADITSTATGGAVLKRTDLRISYLKLIPFIRERVELMPRSSNDLSQNQVSVTNTVAVSVGNTVAITANSAVNTAQIGGQVPLIPATNGSTNRAIVAGIAGPTANTDYSAQAWAAASGSGAVIAEANGLGLSASFDVNVTAWTAGASTGLVVYLQESQDGSTQFYDIWQCETITGVSRVRIPALPIGGRRRMRWVNLTGAATTATVTVTAHEVSGIVAKQVQFFDRTASVGSGTAASGTSTAWYDIAGCKAITVVLDCGTATSVASFQVEMSQTAYANSAYAASAATAVGTTAANRTIIPLTSGIVGRFIRVTCTATGTAQLMNAIHIYGTN
jgi:hypothetical protein